jgi:hypothetical protein
MSTPEEVSAHQESVCAPPGGRVRAQSPRGRGTLEARGEIGLSLPPSLIEQQRLARTRGLVRQVMDRREAPMLLALEFQMRGRWRSHPPDGPPKDLGHDLLLEQLRALRFYPDMPWSYLVWERDRARVAINEDEREAIRLLHDFVDAWLRLPSPNPNIGRDAPYALLYDWTPFYDVELFEEDRLEVERLEEERRPRPVLVTTKDAPRIDSCFNCGKRRPLRAGRNVCEPCRTLKRGQSPARVRTRNSPSVDAGGTAFETHFELKTWDDKTERYTTAEGFDVTEPLDQRERPGKRPQRMSSTGHQAWIRTCLKAAADEAGYSFEDFTAPLPGGRPPATEANRWNALARVVYELHEQGVTLQSIGVALGSNKMQAQRLKNRGKQAAN